MNRLAIVTVAAALSAAAVSALGARNVHRAWSLSVRIAGTAGRPARFRAATSGDAQLVLNMGRSDRWWEPGGTLLRLVPLGAADTLPGTAPAEFPLELRHGTLTIMATDADSLDVVVTRSRGNPLPAAARGRRLVVAESAGVVSVRAR